jgi:isohexenylglutaconyl-CoA hydratase
MNLPSCATLELERDGDWLTIWLNRPAVRNALSSEMTAELRAVFGALRAAHAVRGVTLRGRGGVFCAGGDLKGFRALVAAGSVADVAQVNREAGGLFDLITELPQVLVVLVEGAAMAGGFGLVCAADVVVVTTDAAFAITETSIGLPPAQIAPFVVQRLGLRIARRLMLTAERFDGAEAERLGLADYVAENAEQLAELECRVRAKVLRCAPGANAATKAIALATQRLDRPAMVELAAETFARCLLSDEGREGIAAFLEKRPPSWAAAAGDRARR